jgi:3-oxoacyl-[acyl-carrier-protein] synthase III
LPILNRNLFIRHCFGETKVTNYYLFEMPEIRKGFNERAARASKLPNAQDSELPDLFNEWAKSVTGIESRCHTNKTVEQLASAASFRAVEAAGIDKSEIQAVYGASTSPSMVIPNFVISVAHNLELYGSRKRVKAGLTVPSEENQNTNERNFMTGVPCFSSDSACAGFVAAFSAAYNALRVGAYDTVLVFGSETLSKIFDPRQLKLYVLAGDGAGAFIMRARDAKEGENPNNGVMGEVFFGHAMSDSLLQTNANIPRTLDELANAGGEIDEKYFVWMGGQQENTRRVLKEAVNYFIYSLEEAYKTLPSEFYDPKEPLLPQMQRHVKLVIPHTANDRIHVILERLLGIPVARLINHTGNTSAASVPIAEDQIKKQSTADAIIYSINKGDLIGRTVFGGGCSYGSFFSRE